ncbi:preprotein translocase subunit SecG [Vallitalea okinawensis]|uniref:preprotein translocase subunit SecG n=1 Tax=Vallitalea okinawensis TaxID=2078660 RepID=UPI000CFDC576|nr:preprotein translocase subunit SecG [Vallitalea okinawensis]
MSTAAIIVSILFAIDCVLLIGIVLLQKGKTVGLGTIAGAGESYWGKNKARSLEGKLEKGTKLLATLFIVLALLLYIMM